MMRIESFNYAQKASITMCTQKYCQPKSEVMCNGMKNFIPTHELERQKKVSLHKFVVNWHESWMHLFFRHASPESWKIHFKVEHRDTLKLSRTIFLCVVSEKLMEVANFLCSIVAFPCLYRHRECLLQLLSCFWTAVLLFPVVVQIWWILRDIFEKKNQFSSEKSGNNGKIQNFNCFVNWKCRKYPVTKIHSIFFCVNFPLLFDSSHMYHMSNWNWKRDRLGCNRRPSTKHFSWLNSNWLNHEFFMLNSEVFLQLMCSDFHFFHYSPRSTSKSPFLALSCITC